MTIRYARAKDTDGGKDGLACDYNCALLAEGVEGVALFEARYPTRGEKLDYTQFIPWTYVLAWVEVYVNGAKNFIVQDGDGITVGYIIIRPLTLNVNDGIIKPYSIDN